MLKNNCSLCSSENTGYFTTDFSSNRFFKCNDCGFVFRYQDSLKIENDAEIWVNSVDPDGKRRNLTEERDFKLKNWYGDIIKNIAKLNPGKIIDVGCGLGYLLSALPGSWDKYGFDISDFSRNFMKENFPDIKIISDLKLDNTPPSEEYLNKFDVAVCYHVIEHIQYPDIFLKHLGMLLKPEGILIIGTPNISSLAAKLFKGNFRLFGDGHLGIFSDNTLGRLLQKHGFAVFKREYPFFKTDYFSFANILRMFFRKGISPPFYGNIMIFYAKKKAKA